MSTWDITSNGSKWKGIRYTEGVAESFGETPKAETKFEELVAWLSAEADPGDLITFGGVLLFQKSHHESE